MFYREPTAKGNLEKDLNDRAMDSVVQRDDRFEAHPNSVNSLVQGIESLAQLKHVTTKLQQSQTSVNSEMKANLDGLTRSILQKVSDGILFLNLDGQIVEANEAAQKMFGVSTIQGKLFWEAFADDHLGFSMRESLRYGISHGLIYRHDLEISTSFYYEGPQGLIVRIRDISGRQKMLTIQNRIDRMKDLGEMAASLAHEIRNSLGGIRGFSSLLFRDLVDQPHLQELISRVLEATKGLENLVTAVLVYARPDSVALQTLDLCAHLKQIARILQVDLAFPENIVFRSHILNGTLLVPFDAEALKRCLINLLVNGIQAMPQGGELTLSLFKLDAVCQITIADTGVGMDEGQISSLFSPFFTTKKTGTGLGLVEAKKIIQAHGGTIDVRSMRGRGSTFIVTLPLNYLNR